VYKAGAMSCFHAVIMEHTPQTDGPQFSKVQRVAISQERAVSWGEFLIAYLVGSARAERCKRSRVEAPCSLFEKWTRLY
jgi:hypothetical protein